jgi:hypothetical protein
LVESNVQSLLLLCDQSFGGEGGSRSGKGDGQKLATLHGFEFRFELHGFEKGWAKQFTHPL